VVARRGRQLNARHGIFVAPFEELSDPRVVAELAARAEERGWDGFFIWDHVAYAPPVRALADPWVTLAAVAVATERVTIGPLVTPLPRRRPHRLARETATLDRLSGGRLVLGVGIGSGRTGEFDPERFGEEGDPRERARLLDEGLAQLASYWQGEFEPAPVQSPRIPVWVAARWPNRRPVRRAARWNGLFPIELPGPEALADLAAAVSALRAEVGNDHGSISSLTYRSTRIRLPGRRPARPGSSPSLESEPARKRCATRSRRRRADPTAETSGSMAVGVSAAGR
jgi:alkanesulfonate monooxygenase SsuD/methylene tetrahydromethanopterin reductase-like flavin-dependent oxidoreductase (luciferase family)